MMRNREGKSFSNKGIASAVSAMNGRCPLGLASERARAVENKSIVRSRREVGMREYAMNLEKFGLEGKETGLEREGNTKLRKFICLFQKESLRYFQVELVAIVEKSKWMMEM